MAWLVQLALPQNPDWLVPLLLHTVDKARERGDCPITHPLVLMIQALTTHIKQLCALPDELRQTTIDRYRRLSDLCGCHTASKDKM